MEYLISKNDIVHYRNVIKQNFKSYVEYYRGIGPSYIFWPDDEVENNDENISKIFDHIYQYALDNSVDCAKDAIHSKEIDQSEWEAYADKMVPASFEGIIDMILNERRF